MSARPLVLLSNDDGHYAPGLRALREALLPSADVVVCAPESNQSATSHSLSLHRVLRLRTVEEGIFAVDGTPPTACTWRCTPATAWCRAARTWWSAA